MAHYRAAWPPCHRIRTRLNRSPPPSTASSGTAADGAHGATDLRSLGLLLLLAGVSVGFRLLPLHIEPRAHSALAIAMFMIFAWMTQVLDHGIAGILGCFLFWMFGIAKFETAFSGFADTSPWFLFGAICFGVMSSKSGLARRLAYLVMQRVGYSYPRLLLGLIVSNFLLTAIVPSGIARVVIMAAIAIGLIEAFGVSQGQQHRARDVRHPGVPGDHLRQDADRRRVLDHRPRRDREVRPGRRAVEPLVPGLRARATSS